MFANLIIYRIAPQWSATIDQVEQALAKAPFAECGATQEKSAGWIPPRGEAHGALAEAVGGAPILAADCLYARDGVGDYDRAEFFETFHLGVAFPGPGRLLKFALNFGDELRNLAKHASRWGDVFGKKWQVRRDSNPQLLVLETNALPIELLTCWCLFFRGK